MPDSGSQTLLYSARPTIRVDGTVQQLLAEQDLVSLLVEESTLGLFRCEANFRNWGPVSGGTSDYVYFDHQVLDFGKAFSVEFGPPGATGPIFAGRITGIEASYPSARIPEILVLAEDRLQDLRMERHTRSFENLGDADVIRQIASQNGLTAQVDVDGPIYKVLVQLNQSDLAFLRERVAAIGAELWIDNRTLYVQARSRRDAGQVSLTYGQDLLEFSVLADLSQQRSSVSVTGWSVSDKAAITAQADQGVLGNELAGLSGGSTILAQALTQHQDTVARATPFVQEEAQSMAQARYCARARGFVRGTGVVDGNIKVRVGANLSLSGLGPFFEGSYYVTRARHSFTLQDGWRTTFDAERPGIGV
ncbi:MAG TPA: contractile injection system protein, VgrG/Pvc8 family [Acetobacteraceae bacterium]|nr:contractile injection system protein, VgrG/Pvc8 family [Acetobacteraceae bacterium]